MKIKITVREYEVADDSSEGICVSCGEYRSGCEPDAREYECYECEKMTVYGVSEALIMDLIEIVDEGGGE